MGSRPSSEIKHEAIRKKTKMQVEDIYFMFDETIEIVRNSRVFSSYDQNNERVGSSPRENGVKTSKISNLDSVLVQLLEPFKVQEKHMWGKDVCTMFKKHFKRRFEEMWPISKEEFYKLVLSNCKFQTMDLKQELQEIAESMDIYELSPVRRLTYQRFFNDVVAAKIQEKLPSSFVGEDVLPWEESFRHQDDSETQFNMNAINETIMKHENEFLEQKREVVQPVSEYPEVKESDFLPLFVSTNSQKKTKISENSISETKRNELYNISRIQSASIIAPETVFYERLTQQNKAEIRDLVKFYREFSNALEQMFFSSTSIVSAPYKHFIHCLQEKMKRKNLKTKGSSKVQSPLTANQKKKEKLLRSEDPEARKYRRMREFNNNALLQQIKDFAEAYTDFVWMFLELSQIGESKLGKLLNIYTLYGIVVKSIWKFVQWISDRGCEYQQYKIEEYYQNRPVPNNPNISIEKKKTLINALRMLIGEKNPQKYLKKIVIFYRQANKICACADDLLGIYEQLVIYMIKQRCTREMSLFRMPIIIERLLKLEESMNNAGQISYSWTSWCIVIEILKERIDCGKANTSQLSFMQTEPDYEEVVLEE